jgi:hypothetical protein
LRKIAQHRPGKSCVPDAADHAFVCLPGDRFRRDSGFVVIAALICMRPRRFSLGFQPFSSLAGLALLGLPLATGAQLKAPSGSDPLMPQRFAYAAAADPAGPRISTYALTPAQDDRDALTLRAKRWSSATLVELPRDAAPGTYQRPRYALGFRSEVLRSWLKEAGVDAHTCIAPVLRLRTKLSSEGDLSGALWLYARCSFN